MNNERYATPEKGSLEWHVPLNENFEKLSRDVEVRDVKANRTNYAPTAGALFRATDTGEVFYGDGSQWTALNPPNESPETTGVGGYVSAESYGLSSAADPEQNADALRTAIESNDVVYLPAGTYVCDAVETWNTGNTTIFGRGTLKASPDVDEWDHFLRFRGGENLVLDGLTIDGDRDDDTGRGAVRFENVTAATVKNCEVKNWQDHDGTTDQPHAVNFVGCRGVWATDNHVHHVGAKGINAYARNSDPIDGVVFRGNYVHDTGEEALFCGSEVNTAENPARFIVEGNHLRDNRSQYLVRVAGDGGENHTIIANNTALDASTAAYNYKTSNVTASSVVVANNVYRGGGRAGISVQSTGGGHLAATVTGNRIAGHRGDGILFESGCKNVLCYGNYSNGIRSTDTESALVFGNMTYGYGLDLDGWNVEEQLNLAV
ncbi:right-handed parallel beta-helix repeat-containing protein [Halomarina salina]|uniref:Right-handed parallel beta-helix repeat-containing protein n=1 Tax=Halomarina salina TaxID=1872699 RepID=A0ABD5RH35_9EURY|nr:right-handed parallel beta-helix repeat-containing protein [Halomarina salina]